LICHNYPDFVVWSGIWGISPGAAKCKCSSGLFLDARTMSLTKTPAAVHAYCQLLVCEME